MWPQELVLPTTGLVTPRWFLNSLVGLSQTNSGPAQTNKTLRTFCTFADVLAHNRHVSLPAQILELRVSPSHQMYD